MTDIFTLHEPISTSLTFFNGAIVLSEDKAILYGEEIKDMGKLYNAMMEHLGYKPTNQGEE